MRRRTRSRLFCLILISVTFAITIFLIGSDRSSLSVPTSFRTHPTHSTSKSSPNSPAPSSPGDHPIKTLINNAVADFEALQKRQSTTLSQAVAEYKRRYGISPPPNFDKWYAFAKSHNVVLIDEFDTIHHSLLPFWGLSPAILRERVREALGHDNVLITLQLRQGNITYLDGGRTWMQDALRGMLDPYKHWLPDMDLAFNIHDEPRVIVPHDDLARLVGRGREAQRRAAAAPPRNSWTWHGDLGDGRGVEDARRTRFNFLPHQDTWSHSRQSCPADAPARALGEIGDAADDNSTSLVGALGFVGNQTAYSDVCLSPSFSRQYGFFAGANSFNVAQDLVPVFSQSKLSTYQDILYPSPWYWYGKVPYDGAKDRAWEEKEDVLYWRGATTGGYSRFGGWRHQHRQRFVGRVNSNEAATILARSATGAGWREKEVSIGEYKSVFDVKFTEIGQADAGDAAAQKQAFTVLPKAAPAEAWGRKYLLDMDGNAFSGRFYSFLLSRSAVVKMGISREWHAEWVREWVHYIPLTLGGREWVEGIRWFMDGGEGGGRASEEGRRVAERSREWARRGLRNEDLEVWMFRLLLEYGRVVDDERESVGYVG